MEIGFPSSGIVSGTSGRGSMTVARQRILGASAKMGGYLTVFGCYRAPAHYDAVQIILVSPVSHDPTYKIKATVMAPARFNDGVNGLDSAGSAITPTAVTWGTTQPRNPRNPGGGAADVSLVGASGASPNETEARAISDIIPLASLDRTDMVGAPPLLMVRIQAADPPGISTTGLSGVATGNASLRAVEPDHWCQYLDGDSVATASGVAKTTDDARARWAPAIEIVYYLRGTRVVTIASMGDSLDMGWGNTGTANGTAGLMDGWARKFARQLNAVYPTSFVSYQRDGFTGTRFQEEALNALLGDNAAGITHMFIKPSSVNNNWSANPGSVAIDLRRTGYLIDQCVSLGITPILQYLWAGQSIDSAAGIRIRQYVDAYKAAGGITFDVRKLISIDGTDTNTSVKSSLVTRKSDGSAVDFVHLNDAAHTIIANEAFAQRRQLGFA